MLSLRAHWVQMHRKEFVLLSNTPIHITVNELTPMLG